jgi:cell division protein FtsB
MKRLKRQRFLRQSALLLVLITALAAVASNASEGLKAKRQLEQRADMLTADLAQLKTQRARLEHEADLLGDGAARQPALLEEEARSLLDFAHPSDIVIVDDSPAAR